MTKWPNPTWNDLILPAHIHTIQSQTGNIYTLLHIWKNGILPAEISLINSTTFTSHCDHSQTGWKKTAKLRPSPALSFSKYCTWMLNKSRQQTRFDIYPSSEFQSLLLTWAPAGLCLQNELPGDISQITPERKLWDMLTHVRLTHIC